MNYKITFQVKTPISFQDILMFDGVLAYAYAQEQLKGVEQDTQKLTYSKDELIDFSPMPLVMHPDGYFMASWMFFNETGAVEHLSSWKKRWANEHDELANFGKQKRKVRVNAGTFKSYSMPIRLVDVGECWFYFQSENVSEVIRLLDTHIVGLGKKIAQGYGLISSFEVAELSYNPFLNDIIRPIPTSEKGNNVRYIGFRPPYWMSDNQGYCKVF